MRIKIVALLVFSTGTFKGFHTQIFGLCSSITGKNYTTCFVNFTPKQKKSYLRIYFKSCWWLFLLSQTPVIAYFYLWPVFSPCFFIPCLVIPNTCINISSLYYNVPNYTPRWFFIFRLMFRMYNIETLTWSSESMFQMSTTLVGTSKNFSR